MKRKVKHNPFLNKFVLALALAGLLSCSSGTPSSVTFKTPLPGPGPAPSTNGDEGSDPAGETVNPAATDSGNETPGSEDGEVKPIDYALVQAVIFAPKCNRCHSERYGTYEGVQRDLPAILTSIESNRMPKRGEPLSAADKQLLRDWIDLGAPLEAGVELPPDNVAQPVPPVPPDSATAPDSEKLKPNLQSVFKNIFAPSCAACHNPEDKAHFLDLSSPEKILQSRNKKYNGEVFLNVLDPDSSRLINVVQDFVEPMPPQSSTFPPLTKEQIDVLREWIRRGLPSDSAL